MKETKFTIYTEPKKVTIETQSDRPFNDIATVGEVLNRYLLENRENDEVNNSKEWDFMTELRDFLYKENLPENQDNPQVGMVKISSKLVKNTYTLVIESKPRLFIMSAISTAIDDDEYGKENLKYEYKNYIDPFYTALRAEITANNGY